ncbi:MAG TPA: hypothetical protein VHK90_11935 [Thermoanaerobaculia bacterium]|nr:hypothetical protein [Thermoanaerobaculia bacterium]
MPTVTILSPTKVYPNPVRLMRNDQTIMWQLAPGLRWGTVPVPLEFLPGDGTSPTGVPYSNWPGTNPTPIPNGDPPALRPYWASGNSPMPEGQTEWYHYAMLVEQMDEQGNWSEAIRVQVQREYDPTGAWHDPDVVNDPRP